MIKPTDFPNLNSNFEKDISLTKSRPKYQKSFWDEWFENGMTVSDDFMIDRNQPMPQEREDIFP